jgi:hypothetical protein
MKRESVAIGVSIVALAVSIVSLWSSCEVQRHNRTVTFEQRRQDVRQLILQGQLLSQQMNQEVRAALREEQDPVRREVLADVLHEVNGLLGNFEQLIKGFEAIQATPDTSERLALERIGGKALDVNQRAQRVMEKLRSTQAHSKQTS